MTVGKRLILSLSFEEIWVGQPTSGCLGTTLLHAVIDEEAMKATLTSRSTRTFHNLDLLFKKFYFLKAMQSSKELHTLQTKDAKQERI